MIILKPSDTLKVVTGAACIVTAHVSWVDKGATAITADRQNTAITTATATTIAPSPPSGSDRNAQNVSVANKGATPVSVQVVHDDGTVQAVLWSGVLVAGDVVGIGEVAGWTLSTSAVSGYQGSIATGFTGPAAVGDAVSLQVQSGIGVGVGDMLIVGAGLFHLVVSSVSGGAVTGTAKVVDHPSYAVLAGTAVRAEGPQGPAGAPGSPGVSGAGSITSVRRVTASTTLVAGEATVADQNAAGAGFTLTLPLASSAPSGTPIVVVAHRPSSGTTHTVQTTPASPDAIGPTGSTTTDAVGDSARDLVRFYVNDAVLHRWVRVDQHPHAYLPNGLSTTSALYVSASGSATFWSFGGGMELSAFGDALRLHGEFGIILDGGAGGVHVPPTPAPTPPLIGFTLFCDETTGFAMLQFPTGSPVLWAAPPP